MIIIALFSAYAIINYMKPCIKLQWEVISLLSLFDGREGLLSSDGPPSLAPVSLVPLRVVDQMYCRLLQRSWRLGKPLWYHGFI